MKIGIATFQSGDNYGAVLQAHALQSFFRARGHAVELIRYRTAPLAPLLRRWVAKTLSGCIRKCEAEYKRHIFNTFRTAYLAETPEIFCSTEELEKLKGRFDLLVAGSDQVWNPQWLDQVSWFWDFYFLSFGGTKTRRVSYAASFGHSSLSTLTPDWCKKLGQRLKGMDAISVREPSGVELIRGLCGRTDAIQVVDPTLLMDRVYYEKLIGLGSRRQILFSYMLHGMEQEAESVSQMFADLLNLKVVRCDTHKTALHRGYTLPSPIGWLRQIRDAAFVVTNSFHGVVFCLLFNIPFVVLLIQGPISPMNTRVVELLSAVGLTERMVSSDDDLVAGLLDKTVNWAEVNRQISVMKNGAVEFLNAQLDVVD